jgi:hypothetical protein
VGLENLPHADHRKEIPDERHVSGGSRISDSHIEALVFIAILQNEICPTECHIYIHWDYGKKFIG